MRKNCEICGTPIKPTKNGRYCAVHGREIELSRRRERDRMRKDTATANEQKSSIIAANRVAYEHGMSYGQYYAPAVTVQIGGQA